MYYKVLLLLGQHIKIYTSRSTKWAHLTLKPLIYQEVILYLELIAPLGWQTSFFCLYYQALWCCHSTFLIQILPVSVFFNHNNKVSRVIPLHTRGQSMNICTITKFIVNPSFIHYSLYICIHYTHLWVNFIIALILLVTEMTL